jgi:hypothetical protein
MQRKIIIQFSKMVLPVVLLFFHITSYGIVTYIPQALKECIAMAYELSYFDGCEKELKELYLTIRDNKIFVSDDIVYNAVKEAIIIIGSPDNRINRKIGAEIRDERQGRGMTEYLEEYLRSLQNRSVLLAVDGKDSHSTSWSAELIEHPRDNAGEIFDLLRLSNQLSENLMVCGQISMGTHPILLSSRVIAHARRKPKLDRLKKKAFGFRSENMTDALTHPAITDSIGIGDLMVKGWALTPSTHQQCSISMQVEIPNEIVKNKKAVLEVGMVVPSNGLSNEYANFELKSKYLVSRHNFDPTDMSCSHISSSGNFKIDEASVAGNLKYMTVRIPLASSHIKSGCLALLNISRTLPTDLKSEYTSDLYVVSATLRYTCQ